MPKTLITLRASAETIRKIEAIKLVWGGTKSEIITVAIDRMYEKETKQAQAHTEGKDNE